MPSVYPIEFYPADYRGHYPNMAKRDAAVWARFLAAHAARFLGFGYNVAVGGVRVGIPGVEGPDADAWQYATALKIDAVALAESAVWIIEVKPEAHVSALGAALAYTLVAAREALFDRPLQAAIVCEYAQPDVLWCAERLGVTVVVV